ncbi:MAG: hypothetical protein KHY61_10545, partial [Sutterella wadsworthensis]|nr:hypothetical protein [Sutterella wadsworthensis]
RLAESSGAEAARGTGGCTVNVAEVQAFQLCLTAEGEVFEDLPHGSSMANGPAGHFDTTLN